MRVTKPRGLWGGTETPREAGRGARKALQLGRGSAPGHRRGTGRRGDRQRTSSLEEGVCTDTEQLLRQNWPGPPQRTAPLVGLL